MIHPLLAIPEAYRLREHRGITSVCSAHPVVIEAALQLGRETDRIVLIEATCNQVNQDGGYTGMTPKDFRRFVEEIASRAGYDPKRIVLGGDHLGPNPWKHLPAEEAMTKAEAMIAAYAEAGFTKLHLDTSMGCAGESVALADTETAGRAARLAAVAERHRTNLDPVYVIGTEVPVPGGATHELDELELTDPNAVGVTYEVHREAFHALKLHDAFSRVIALVVQPGVEFGHTDVIHFDAQKAAALSRTLDGFPGIVFEAHSTDYQSAEGLHSLVAQGFAILKVGPWLTFALREALYALDAIADIMDGHEPRGRLMAAMESVMLSAPDNWKKYYPGDDREQWLHRHFSLSDRIRYYWPSGPARAAVEKLMDRIGNEPIPGPLLHQYFPAADLGLTELTGRDTLIAAVKDVLAKYERATHDS